MKRIIAAAAILAGVAFLLQRITRKGGENMIMLFALLIARKMKTMADVPAHWQDAVRAYLAVMELGETGDPLQP